MRAMSVPPAAPDTIPVASVGHKSRSSHAGVAPLKSTDFLCSIQYQNSLPDVPVDAKFLRVATDGPLATNSSADGSMKRFSEWCPTSSLLRLFRYPVSEILLVNVRNFR